MGNHARSLEGRCTLQAVELPGNHDSHLPQSSRQLQAATAEQPQHQAAEDLGLQTGMSLLDTQNLNELAETEEQPASHRTMSMFSTMGSLGTLVCPAAPRDSDSEDSRSASEDSADSATDSGMDDITVTGPYSSLGAASTSARLAGERERLQARSAAAALEATRQRREASAARAGADARPVFMKALQILAGGASEVAATAAATSDAAQSQCRQRICQTKQTPPPVKHPLLPVHQPLQGRMLPQAAVCSQGFPDLRLMRHQPRPLPQSKAAKRVLLGTAPGGSAPRPSPSSRARPALRASQARADCWRACHGTARKRPGCRVRTAPPARHRPRQA